MTFSRPPQSADRQPIFNIPPVLLAILVILIAIHLVRETLLTDAQSVWVILNFAYFPGRPDIFLGQEQVAGSEIWSFLTYSLLHADWTHLGLNSLWMVAFGSPLAWRFGPVRFLAFSAAAVVAGAAVHAIANSGDQLPMIGASAAVSAHMAGAARFLFIAPPGGVRSYRSPAAPMRAVFSDPRTLTFLGVWFGINVAIGLIGWFSDDFAAIAWEAHIGGFIAGLVLFPVFDRAAQPSGDPPDPRA